MTMPAVTSLNGLPVAAMPTDVDVANAALVGEQLAGAVTHDAPCLVLDLTGTRYLDSAGIDMLLKLAERLRNRRQTLLLVVAEGSPLRRLLTVMGVDASLPVHASVAEAAESGGGGPGTLSPR
ncbi:MAG TPA: STAS domain-containing protein [Solirubrobacteraceae bacterium]|jgi:anti-anti-sigma factor|nr:STAS domain-containing protein [Solirubrobacteraceae bacterium]